MAYMDVKRIWVNRSYVLQPTTAFGLVRQNANLLLRIPTMVRSLFQTQVVLQLTLCMNIVLNPSALSLQDEARNTERHSLWSSSVQLRHTQVNFVMAENVEAYALKEARHEKVHCKDSMKHVASGPLAHPDMMNPEACKTQIAVRSGDLDVKELQNELSKPLQSTSSSIPCQQGFLMILSALE